MESENNDFLRDDSYFYEYEDKIARITQKEFFDFFKAIGAEPKYEGNNIRLLELCHKGKDHAVMFYTDTLTVHCFAGCNTMMLHNWVKHALDLDCAPQAKELIEDWIKDRKLDLSGREANKEAAFPTEGQSNTGHKNTSGYEFTREHIETVEGIPEEIVKDLYSEFDGSYELLDKLTWHTKEGIATEQLQRFDVAYFHKRGTIILPHHNINGEIVGLYERNCLPLRKEVEAENPDLPYEELLKYPRAKYLPLVKLGKYAPEKKDKVAKKSWSFPNSRNLYGLHLAKDAIAETGKAIIFEGGKSVMLAHQYGYPYAVASHTFGCSLNHINMLLDCGAKEIIFAFDRQYQDTDSKEFETYQKKTAGLAEKLKDYVKVSRIIDTGNLLDYKDAPIDKGKEVFDELFNAREQLTGDECELIF